MRVLRKRDCQAKLGLKGSSFDDLRRNDPTFPAAIALGARSIGFLENEVDDWIASRPRIGAEAQPSTGSTAKPASPKPRSVGTPA